jgi:hypothetical protein
MRTGTVWMTRAQRSWGPRRLEGGKPRARRPNACWRRGGTVALGRRGRGDPAGSAANHGVVTRCVRDLPGPGRQPDTMGGRKPAVGCGASRPRRCRDGHAVLVHRPGGLQ